MNPSGVREQRRRVEVVEYCNVDLAGPAAHGIDHECRRGSVAFRQVAIEKLKPVMFGCRSGSGRMLKKSAHGKLGEHFLLHSAEDLGEVDLTGIGSARHDGLRIADQIAGGSRPKREVIDRRQDRLSHCNPQEGSQSGEVMVGRDELRLLLLWMVGRFRLENGDSQPISATDASQRRGCSSKSVGSPHFPSLRARK